MRNCAIPPATSSCTSSMPSAVTRTAIYRKHTLDRPGRPVLPTLVRSRTDHATADRRSLTSAALSEPGADTANSRSPAMSGAVQRRAGVVIGYPRSVRHCVCRVAIWGLDDGREV